MSRTQKFRGSRTHGRGKKSGRGAGIHGGRGNAGLHKHKYKSMLKYAPEHFGRRGFKRPIELVTRKTAINLFDIENNLERLFEEKVAKKEGDYIYINLAAKGIDKLLGSGKATRAMKIFVSEASEKAKAKVEAAGGTIQTGKIEG